MTQIHVIIKSFQWYQIKNTILFIKKIQFLLNKPLMTKSSNSNSRKKNLSRYENSDFLFQNRLCEINTMNLISFPKKRKLFTVLRSPHIDKKSREQFQFVFHKLKVVLNEKNDNKVNLFIFLLKNSEFPGVEMEIVLNYHSCLQYLQT
jgi:ribosomal protein S10